MRVLSISISAILCVFVMFPQVSNAALPAKEASVAAPSGVVANPPPLHPVEPGVTPNVSGNVQNSGTPLIPTGASDSDPKPVQGQITDLAGRPVPETAALAPGLSSTSKAIPIVAFVLIVLLFVGWYFTSKKKK